MLKRTLFFSNPYHLGVRNGQLTIESKADGSIKTCPIEDLGFVILEDPQITLTQKVVQMMNHHNVALVFCNESRHPSSMLFHLDGNQIMAENYRNQLDCSEPLRKNLWRHIVQQKIRNQAWLLKKATGEDWGLTRLVKEVRSGDVGNQEGMAARRYWPKLLGPEFSRQRGGVQPNGALNYGYAILRAAVARAIVGSGLLPALGLFHRNRYNHFPLADDLMEPYRPFVDELVCTRWGEGQIADLLSGEDKAWLLGILSRDVRVNAGTRPLMNALSLTTSSLVRSFNEKEVLLVLPEFP